MTTTYQAALSRCVLALLTGTAASAGRAADAPVEAQRQSAVVECRVVGADPQRLASKFALGLAACPRSAALPARADGRGAREAQQLYLYETTPERTPEPAPADAGATRARPAGPRLSQMAQRALLLAPTVDAAARRHDIDPLLLHAIARVESHHNPAAVSPAGALGVMQLMPATASRFGVTTAQALHDAPTNVAVGASYLKTLQQRFGNDLVLVLAAYNAGEGAVERYGRRVPPYAETRGYVRDVLAEYALLRRAAALSKGKGAML